MFETVLAVVGIALTEPRIRETSGGDRVASFRIGSTARRYDRTAQRWVDGDRFFATVNCWRRLAEGVQNEVRKTSPVVVAGRLRTREFELNGQWRTAVEIEANAVGLDLARAGTAHANAAALGEADSREPPRSGEAADERIEHRVVADEVTLPN